MAFPSVDWEEIEGQSYSYSRTDGSAMLTYKVPLKDLDLFRANLFPEPYIAGSTVVQPPAASWPGNPWLVAKGFKVDPFDKESPLGQNETPAAYQFYRCEVSFVSTDYDQFASNPHSDTPNAGAGAGWPTTFTSLTASVGGEMFGLPEGFVRWQNPSSPAFDVSKHPWGPTDYWVRAGGGTTGAIVLPSVELSLVWHFVPFPPWIALFQNIGRVNHSPFSNFPAECLLFLGVEASRDSTSQGLRTWELTYKFSCKNQNWGQIASPMGWNHFPRFDGQSAGQFQRLQRKIPAGETAVNNLPKTTPVAAGVTFLPVVVADGFPPTGTFLVGVGSASDQEVLTASVGTTTLGGAAVPALAVTSPTANAHAVGEDVVQLLQTTVTSGCAQTDTQLIVGNAAACGGPPSGQFFLAVGAQGGSGVLEVMCCTSYAGNSLVFTNLLRGVQGTPANAHAAGEIVSLYPSTIYEMMDASQLFTSGLIVG